MKQLIVNMIFYRFCSSCVEEKAVQWLQVNRQQICIMLNFFSEQAPFNEIVFSMASTDQRILDYFTVYSNGAVATRKNFLDIPSPNQFIVSFPFLLQWAQLVCSH